MCQKTSKHTIQPLTDIYRQRWFVKQRHWLSWFVGEEGWTVCLGEQQSTPTFSAWASRDFRLLVTVFNSSSSSEHLLVFYTQNTEERRRNKRRKSTLREEENQKQVGTEGHQGTGREEQKKQKPKINQNRDGGQGEPEVPLTQQECATMMNRSLHNCCMQVVRSYTVWEEIELQHSCQVRRAWNKQKDGPNKAARVASKGNCGFCLLQSTQG